MEITAKAEFDGEITGLTYEEMSLIEIALGIVGRMGSNELEDEALTKEQSEIAAEMARELYKRLASSQLRE